ncbi:hypothetical protein [Burkholderia sp. RS02]|uniref:hypothetical protein n=1 Tax=unclassified Burkholderia TaxID=2613784 RepID=UPI00321821E0
MTNNNTNSFRELTESQIEQIARNHCPDMPDGQDAMVHLKCAIHEALDMSRSVAQPLKQLCPCGTTLAHVHHHCDVPVMWRMYEKSDVFANASAAARDVLVERRRQIEVERRETGCDDQYTNGELPEAAVAYALSAAGWDLGTATHYWPSSWAGCWFKPTTPRRDLVKAAALILAEIERTDRAAGGIA